MGIPFDAPSFLAKPTDPVRSLPGQTLDDVQSGWPKGTVRVDLSAYMVRPNQHWTIAPVPSAGGWFGAPFYRITVAGTKRALAATQTGEVEAVASFTGDDTQLWRIDQLTDGTYRITPKTRAGEDMALTAIGASTPTLAKFDPASDTGRWRLVQP